MNVIVQ